MIGAIFAATDTVPVSAESLFKLGSLTVTNSMFTGTIIGLIIVGLFVFAAARSKVRPTSKFAFFIESVVDFLTKTISDNFGDDTKKARKFAPLFLTLFVFILLNNLSDLMPGLDSAIYLTNHDGIKQALLRPFTTDLNGTFALAAIAMAVAQYYAIKDRGIFRHIHHYFSVAEPWWNPMNLFLGPLEIISEITRLLTLALRLFGVIYAGEVLLHVIAQLTGNFAWIGTVPVALMELFFASIQAYLFIMLSSVYLQMGTSHDAAEPDVSHLSTELPTEISKSVGQPA